MLSLLNECKRAALALMCGQQHRILVCVCVCVYVCVCVCVSVRQRERARKKERKEVMSCHTNRQNKTKGNVDIFPRTGKKT